MAPTYQRLDDGTVEVTDTITVDGEEVPTLTAIPADERNADYLALLEAEAAGEVVIPDAPPPVEDPTIDRVTTLVAKLVEVRGQARAFRALTNANVQLIDVVRHVKELDAGYIALSRLVEGALEATD